MRHNRNVHLANLPARSQMIWTVRDRFGTLRDLRRWRYAPGRGFKRLKQRANNMVMTPSTKFMRIWTHWAALGGCVLVSSCSHVNLRGEGLQDNFGSALRAKPAARGETWSLTTKGREIERNLGN